MGGANIFERRLFLQLHHYVSHCLFTPSLNANTNMQVHFVFRVILNGCSNLSDLGEFVILIIFMVPAIAETDCKLPSVTYPLMLLTIHLLSLPVVLISSCIPIMNY